MDWIDYREQLDIGFNDEGKRQFFVTNMFNILDVDGFIPQPVYNEFCMVTGNRISGVGYSDNCYSYVMDELSDHSQSIKDFISYYTAFANAHNKWASSHDFGKKIDYFALLKRELDRAHIDFEVINDGDKSYVFPKGVKQFDKDLVTSNLYWLKDYPDARIAWSKALSKYADADEDNASDVADGFRKALEQLFQSVFGGSKNLENYISDYGFFLKSHGVPKELSGEFEKLLNLYTKFNNKYAKHGDKTRMNVLEYIMYQTGIVMRFVIILKQEHE